MAQPEFASILDRSPTEIERPKPIPVGSYVTVLVGQPRQDKSAKKQTEFVEFTHKFLSAGDDVDEDALKEALTSADGSVKNLSEVTMKNTYYLTENSAYRLKDFLADCGFDMEDASNKIRNILPETNNTQVGVYVSHEPSRDGTTIYANITKTFAVE